MAMDSSMGSGEKKRNKSAMLEGSAAKTTPNKSRILIKDSGVYKFERTDQVASRTSAVN